MADETDIMNHPLVQTTEAFLIKYLQLSPVSGTKGAVTAGVKGNKGKKGDVKGGEKEGHQKGRMVDGDKGDGAAVVKEPNIVLFISLSGGMLISIC